MNCMLFDDLFRITIVNSPEFHISKEDFLLFLLGELSHQNDPSKELFSYEEVKKCLKGQGSQPFISLRRTFGNRYLKFIRSFCKPSLDDLVTINYRIGTNAFNQTKQAILARGTEISSLYQKYSLPMPRNNDPEKLLSRLFTICIAEPQSQLFASYRNQKLKPSTIRATLGRNDDASSLMTLLKTHHKIILSGPCGSGKSRFIHYCLSVWKLEDYCYICYDGNLESTLRKIRYQDSYGNEYTNASADGLMNKDFSSSLLIIDNMNFSPESSKELEQLSSMAVDIIILSAGNICSDSFYNYALPSLNDETLCDIFESCSKITIKDQTLKGKLLDTALRNVLMISLIAYQCKKMPACEETADNYLLEQILNELNRKNSDSDLSTSIQYKYKHSYDKETLNLIGHVKTAYQHFLDSASKDFDLCMKWLSSFGCDPIPAEFISTVFPNDMLDQINELSEAGFIQQTEGTYSVSPMISYTVIASRNQNFQDYVALAERLTCFCKKYDLTLSVPYLSGALHNFVQSLYPYIPVQNNPNQKSVAARYENWQELLYLIVNYYVQNGASELVQKTISLIHYPDSLKSTHNAFEKLLLNFCNEMQKFSSFSSIPEQIDDLIKALSLMDSNSSDHEVPSIDMKPLIINTLDTALSWLCMVFLRSDNAKYLNERCYIEVLKALLKYNVLKDLCEKKVYYETCYSLYTNKNLSTNEFAKHRSCFSKFQNLDYRIRGIAFTIFLQCTFIYNRGEPDLLEAEILPQLNELDELISSCRLIPLQTFRLCLYTYITVLTVQYVFLHNKVLHSSGSPSFLSGENFRNLFNRCNLGKEILDEAMKLIDSILKIMEI